MSILKELLQLNEKTLSSILKSSFKSTGSFQGVFGADAEKAVELLDASMSDAVFKFHASSPAQLAAKKSVLHSPVEHADESMKMVIIPGRVRVLLYGGELYSTARQIGRLVEDA